MSDSRRNLPSVSAVLDKEEIQSLLTQHPRTIVVDAIRDVIDEMRSSGAVALEALIEGVRARVSTLSQPTLRPVINATGIVLHTNLGRAPLPDAAINAVIMIAGGYTNLEYDLDEGRRGSRYSHCVSLLKELTGAEDAIVVNNCASALVLALSALSRGREVIVSRGELVEIGGSFRVPDIMGRSGATLAEVGTTNRTHLDDYVRAINSRTGAIAKIHRSNFSIEGFVADVEVRQLAPIAREHGIPILHDLGSGLLMSLDEYGLSGEPTATQALNAGATLVMMSGDKLLGGPQAGIIVGKKYAIDRLKKDPFARAMRVDKLTIAALSATLALYRDPQRAITEIPTLAMITTPAETILKRCIAIQRSLDETGIGSEVIETFGSVGAGAFPTRQIPSFGLSFGGDAVESEQKLRASDTPVIGYIADDRVVLDLRSVPPRFDELLSSTIRSAFV
ncbi:MAG TPA: L-seryl-tRNA(Sec) selenium transferase [Gemmatimonadaceae bacterium]|jgi:L-seryl-tRNA(Ser) seleniumtransferase|nr:L-seryl-tRNA(Sec) selenium transferase [Gemmatimonadaceae bacterium]